MTWASNKMICVQDYEQNNRQGIQCVKVLGGEGNKNVSKMSKYVDVVSKNKNDAKMMNELVLMNYSRQTGRKEQDMCLNVRNIDCVYKIQ